jgi:hypothetical protein
MMKKFIVYLAAVMFLPVLTGCIPLLAGAAGGAGTAAWLSGKMVQEFHSSYENTIDASKQALIALNLNVDKETRQDTVTQIRSQYSDGREIWVDVHKLTEDTSRVEVRVGVGDKEAASKIMKKIELLLP